MLKKLEVLHVKDARQFIQMANSCQNRGIENIYQMAVNRRNHPRECLELDSQCTSDLLLLRQLAVHYKNCRQIYQLLNSLKIADHFISDFDAALVLGDANYLLKLLAYRPILSSKTFDVERENAVVNEQTMAEQFGQCLADFYKNCSNLPNQECVSCNQLVREEKCLTITERWGKVGDPTSEYGILLRYLQSRDWTNLGGEFVDSLIGKKNMPILSQ